MITIESSILSKIPDDIQTQIARLPKPHQQIFTYIFNQAIQYSETHELTTNIPDIAEETLLELLNPKSKANQALSLSQYKLSILNHKIDRAILRLHGCHPPFPTATSITEAEIILEEFHRLFVKQQADEESKFIEQCSTFEGRELLRSQYEEWEIDPNKKKPLPHGYIIPQESEPYATQIATERQIQRALNRGISFEAAQEMEALSFANCE